VRLPVLALSLRDDPIAPPGALADLLAMVPNADVTRDAFDGVSSDAPWRRHFSWARQPAGVDEPVAKWLARVAPSAHGSALSADCPELYRSPRHVLDRLGHADEPAVCACSTTG